MSRIRLFVYGSLKRGFAHAAQMEGALFEREVVAGPGYSLRRVGSYPALVEEGTGVVHGELYSVSREHLARLDVFEGCPDLYRRALVRLRDGGLALAYVMEGTTVERSAVVPGGCWVDASARDPE